MGNGGIAKAFVQEFVIGFGFLSGLWINVGVNPESEIYKALIEASGQSSLYIFLWILDIIFILGIIYGSYRIACWFGLVAVGLAFFGGIFITFSAGIWLLIFGLILGLFAPNLNKEFSNFF